MLPVIAVPLVTFAIGPSTLALCEDVKRALHRARISHKAAAIDLRTREPKLSDQLNGKEPFTLWWRFADLGDVFWQQFNDVRAERFGQRVVPRDLGLLIETIESLDKRMAKMHLPAAVEQERSA